MQFYNFLVMTSFEMGLRVLIKEYTVAVGGAALPIPS
jgi:hypothetical protein